VIWLPSNYNGKSPAKITPNDCRRLILKRILIIVVLTLCLVYSIPGTAVLAASSYQWHTFYGSGSPDRAYSIATDSTSCSIIVGRSRDTWNGPAGQTPLYDHSNPADSPDIFVLKLDSNGDYLWHTFFGTADVQDYGMGVAVDGDDNIYVTGFSCDAWKGPLGEDPKHLYSGGAGDAFVFKLNSSGAYQWHTFYGSGVLNYDLQDEGHAIAIDAGNNVYVAMKTGEAWLGPLGEPPKNDYAGAQDIAVLKLDGDGNYLWHTFFGSVDGDDDAGSIAVDGSAVYVAGTSAGTSTGNPALGGDGGGVEWDNPVDGPWGNDDIVVIKLDNTGAYQWHTFQGEDGNDGANGIAASNGSIYVAGYSFNAGEVTSTQDLGDPVSDQADIAVLKLDSAGTYQWHGLYGSSTNDDFGLDVALSGSGSGVYIIGRSLAAWDNGSSGPNHSYTGDADLVVLKVNSSGVYQWHTFYGSAGEDLGQDIALDTRGYIHAVGTSRAAWNGDGGVLPRHGYTLDQDIYELSLTDISPGKIQGVGGEVRPVSKTGIFQGLIVSNQWPIIWIGLPTILAISIGILAVRQRKK
jgi:hypothetical protein